MTRFDLDQTRDAGGSTLGPAGQQQAGVATMTEERRWGRFERPGGIVFGTGATVGRLAARRRGMELQFSATVIHWRGPAPFFYARLPMEAAAQIARVKRAASYGWGVIPVVATIDGVAFETSLFPRDGTYLLPLKAAVRNRLGVTVGDEVAVEMRLNGVIREPDL